MIGYSESLGRRFESYRAHHFSVFAMAMKILKLIAMLHIAGGLFLFASAFSPAAVTFMQGLISGNEQYVWSTFFATVLGPTIASWGVLFAALLQQFESSPTMPVWRALVISILLWAPLDSALCLKFGITIGVVVNTIVLVVVLGLLLASRRDVP